MVAPTLDRSSAGADGGRDATAKETWRRVSGPSAVLKTLWASAATNVYAAGVGGALFHYDGRRWTKRDIGTKNDINWLWGAGPTEIYAAGRFSTLRLYDGKKWGQIGSLPADDWNAVWGTGSKDVYAAGGSGNVVRWNGARWDVLRRPSSGKLTARGVWAFGPSDVYVVGSLGLKLVIQHFNGRTWSSVGPTTLNDLGGQPWVSTKTAYIPVGNAGLVRFDGSKWKTVNPGIGGIVRAVWGTTATDVYAAGLNNTAIARFNGSVWTKAGTSKNFKDAVAAIGGGGPLDVWAVVPERTSTVFYHYGP